MRKLIIILLILVATPNALAYWDEHDITDNVSIRTATWLFTDSWNIDLWDNYNKEIPEGQVFSYQGMYYVSIAPENNPYVPAWHGLPKEARSMWAHVSLSLDWLPNMNYRHGSTVIREGRWFFTNVNYHGTKTDWFVNDPITDNGLYSMWREIEPLDTYPFNMIEELNIPDYRVNEGDVTYV